MRLVGSVWGLALLLATWIPTRISASFVAGYQVQLFVAATNGSNWLAVDNSSYLWTSDVTSDSLSRYDSSGNLVHRTFLSNPAGQPIVIDGFGNLWTPHGPGGSVSKIDGNGNYLGTYACASDCFFAAVDPFNNVWVDNDFNDGPASGAVTKITNAGVSTQYSNICWFPYGLALDSGGKMLVVCAGDSTVVQFDPSSGSVLNTWPTSGSFPVYLAVDAQGNIFTANQASGTVSKLSSSGSFVWQTSNGGLNNPTTLAIDSQGRIWVTEPSSGQVVVLANSNGAVIHTFNIGTSVGQIVMDSQSNFYVCETTIPAVYKLVAPTNSPSRSPTQSPLPVVTGGYNLIHLPADTNCGGGDVSPDQSSDVANAQACANLCTSLAGSSCIGFTYLSDPNNKFGGKNCFPKVQVIPGGTYEGALCYELPTRSPTNSPSTSTPSQSPTLPVAGYTLVPLTPYSNCAGGDLQPDQFNYQVNAAACAAYCDSLVGSGCIGFGFIYNPPYYYGNNCFPKNSVVPGGASVNFICYVRTTSSPSSASPTSARPSSISPTSASPTSASPTSSAPSSQAPTSASPTSSTPSSSSPSSSVPVSTTSPTSGAPSSAAPVTLSPSEAPTRPTSSPTSSSPSRSPTSSKPTSSPLSSSPSRSPSRSPSSEKPTKSPTRSPTKSPTTQRPTRSPSFSPSARPTLLPSVTPTFTGQTYKPSRSPTTQRPSQSPVSSKPSRSPSASPTSQTPTRSPSSAPTLSAPTSSPTSASPSLSPFSAAPSSSPSLSPTTSRPSRSPSTSRPSSSPIRGPTRSPSRTPTTSRPSYSPTNSPLPQEWYDIQNLTNNFSIPTIYLINNIDYTLDNFTVEGLVIPYGRNVTIYGNGYKLQPRYQGRAITVRHGATLTLVDVVIETGNASYLPPSLVSYLPDPIYGQGWDCQGNDLTPGGLNATSVNDCGEQCTATPLCQGFAYYALNVSNCFLKSAVVFAGYGNVICYRGLATGLATLAQLPTPVIHDDGYTAYYPMFVGGGVFNAGTLSLSKVVFDSNEARAGGALFNWGTVVDIESCTFSNNKAYSIDYGSTLDPDYPALQKNMYSWDFARSSGFYQAWLAGNPAYLYRGGGAIAQVNQLNNPAFGEFGIQSINNTKFLSNTAGTYGGAIYVSAGMVGQIIGSTFTSNAAVQQPIKPQWNGINDVLVMTAGGAIAIIRQEGSVSLSGGNASLPLISRSTFTNNKATSQVYAAGGALYVGGTGAPYWNSLADNFASFVGASTPVVGSIQNCVFTGNLASVLPAPGATANNTQPSSQHYEQAHGGALAFSAEISAIVNSVFSGNSANASGALFPVSTYYDGGYGGGNGGAIASVGGARQLEGWPVNNYLLLADHLIDGVLLSITNTVFRNNSASYQGGAMALQGGYVPMMNNVTFLNNFAGRAGALSLVNSMSNWIPTGVDALDSRTQSYAQTQQTFVSNSLLQENQAQSQCSAICVDSYSALTLTNVKLFANVPALVNDTSSTGSIAATDTPNTNLQSCNLSSNVAWLGGAVYVIGGVLEISNTQFQDNQAYQGGSIFSDFGSSIVASHVQFIRSTALSDCLQGQNSPQSGSCFDGVGGAIYSGGSLDVLYSTFVNSSIPNVIDAYGATTANVFSPNYISPAAARSYHTSVGLDVYAKILGRVGGSNFTNSSRYSRFSPLAPSKRFYTCSNALMCGPSSQCINLNLPSSTNCLCSNYLAGGSTSQPYDQGVGCKGFTFESQSFTLTYLESAPSTNLTTSGTLVLDPSDPDYNNIRIGLSTPDELNGSSSSNITYAYYQLTMSESYFSKRIDYFEIGFVNNPAEVVNGLGRPLFHWTWRPNNVQLCDKSGVCSYSVLLRLAVGRAFLFNVFAAQITPFPEQTQASALTPVAIVCPPGSFIFETYTCKQCPEKFYGRPTPSLITECSACPENLPSSDAASTSKADCVSLTGQLTLFDSTGAASTILCPAYALCDKLNTTVESITLRYGYWRAINSSLQILPCLHEQYCWGGNASTLWSWDFSLPDPEAGHDGLPPGLVTDVAAVESDNSTSAPTSNRRRSLSINGSIITGLVPYCRPGHTGALCESCLQGFYLQRGVGCFVCDATSSNPGQIALQMFIFVIIIVAIGGAFLYYQERQMKRLRDQGGKQERVSAASRWLQDQLVKLKILLGLAQVAASFAVTFGAVYPQAVLNLMQRLSILSLDFSSYFSFGCAATVNHYTELVVTVLTPAFFIGILVGFDALVNVFSKDDKVKLDFRRGAITGAVWILFLIYPAVSNKILSTFSCTCFEDGECVLTADYSVSCKDAARPGWVAFAAIMVFFYPIGVPVSFLWILRKNVAKINPPGDDVDAIVQRRILDPEIAHLKVLFYAYEPIYWYWEVVELFRKLMVTSVAAFFVPGTATQIVLTLLVSMFFMGVMASYRPYLEDKDDLLASVAQWGLCVTLLSGIVFKLNVSAQDGYSSMVYTVLVYISLITPMASAVYEAVTELAPNYKLSNHLPKWFLSDDTRSKMESRTKTKRPSEVVMDEEKFKNMRENDEADTSAVADRERKQVLATGAVANETDEHPV